MAIRHLSRKSVLSSRVILSAAQDLLLLVAIACGRADNTESSESVDPRTAALPAQGSSLPSFSYPTKKAGVYATPDSFVRTTVFATDSLKGRPTLLALWSWHSPDQEAGMYDLDSLMRRYEHANVRWVVIADHRPDANLDTVLDHAGWAKRADVIALGYQKIAMVFDQTAGTGAFQLPSFLLIGDDGRVLRRAFGTPRSFANTLDSLAGQHTRQVARADSGLADQMRTRLGNAFSDFDPNTLLAKDTLIDLNVGCGADTWAQVALVPAFGRVLSVKVERAAVFATVELVSVAQLELGRERQGADDLNLCDKKKLVVTPGIETDTFNFRFEHSMTSARDTSPAWVVIDPLPSTNPARPNAALVPLLPAHGYIKLPSDASVRSLRQRIDSVRAAQLR